MDVRFTEGIFCTCCLFPFCDRLSRPVIQSYEVVRWGLDFNAKFAESVMTSLEVRWITGRGRGTAGMLAVG